MFKLIEVPGVAGVFVVCIHLIIGIANLAAQLYGPFYLPSLEFFVNSVI
jgi:hypothetical protein